MCKQLKWILGALLALTLAACGKESDKEQSEGTNHSKTEHHDDDNHNKDDHNHSEGQETRFIASSATGIHMFNGNFEEVKSFHFSNASLSQIANSSYVFVKDKEQNSNYQFLHAGVWTEDHGDHSHAYKEDAVLFETSIKGSKPAHVVSFGDQVAVFNDGDGSVQKFINWRIYQMEVPLHFYTNIKDLHTMV